MSAEKKTSNGAPFSICERKFPEDPVVTRTVQPVAFWKFATISLIASVRSAAAATVIVPQGFCTAFVAKNNRGAAQTGLFTKKHDVSLRGALRAEESLLFYAFC